MALTIAETIDQIRVALRDYIEATYHVGHPDVVAQRREVLDKEGVLFKEPFIESTPRYQTDRSFAELDVDPSVRHLLAKLTRSGEDFNPILYDPPYIHQAEALEFASRDGKSLAITTGTGSGKTEAFLLPMLAKLAIEASHRRESFKTPAVRVLILYPMNALVNDQLGRLRLLLGDSRVTSQFEEWADRPARFARYTSRTLYPGVRTTKKDQQRLKSIKSFYVGLVDDTEDLDSPTRDRSIELKNTLISRGKWPAKSDIKAWYGSGRWKDQNTGNFRRAVTQQGDAELLTRHEVLAEPPDVLITNYSMLEYMLMRPLERPVFDTTRQWLEQNPEEKFLLIVDEAHLYRGAAGAEVALLLRRLRARLGISPERLQVITTSASFTNPTTAIDFAAQLTGKDSADFCTVTSPFALRDGAGIGSAEDASGLAAISLDDFYEAETDEARIAAVSDFLTTCGVTHRDESSEVLLHKALESYAPMNLLINETMEKAQRISELGSAIFPTAEASVGDRAVTALVALGSAARKSSDEAGLLPCRVHAFFRGLPGLWACLDPGCQPQGDNTLGPIGKLYHQPKTTCDCCQGRVFELYTCRDCGSAYARAYTDDLSQPDFLWNEPGRAFQSTGGAILELFALDLLLEAPTREEEVEVAELDLVTGRLNPRGAPERYRIVFLKKTRHGHAPAADDDENVGEANGEFKPCGVCEQTAGGGRSSVQNHQTKGDQPFQALLTRQIEVQPPSAPYSDFAPLRGRKVMAFADSRQVAARLAPKLQSYTLKDIIRPLIIRGWADLASDPIVEPNLNLEMLYLAVMVGAKRLKVRLRPELRPTETLQPLRTVGDLIDAGALSGNDPAKTLELLMNIYVPPQSLLRMIHVALTDKYYGLAALGLASLREKSTLTDELVGLLPAITGVAESDEARLALLRLWLAQWGNNARGIWFQTMTDEWWNVTNGVHPHTGNFKKITNRLIARGPRQEFERTWLPVLRTKFCERRGDHFRLLASHVALEIDGNWGYCDRCRFTQRVIPESTRCINCAAEKVRVIDPKEDDVFRTRKGYYRASTERALEAPDLPIMSIIAAEHTAQLNAAQNDDVFSKAEEHEFLFQDMNIQLPTEGDSEHAAIDVLSCTTTMEVGIDIGSLSGVALRNMPPSRANYQQRAGRAGRRGNAVATVIAFGSSDTHDDEYFRNPALMIRGPVLDPVLTLDNEEIARRHVTAYLLQRYSQDRIPYNALDDQPQLFEVLGTVSGFTGGESTLNRADLEQWLCEREEDLCLDVDGWLPVELATDARQNLLSGLVTRTLQDIDRALGFDHSVVEPERGGHDADDVEEEGEVEEDGAGHPNEQRSVKNLLDRLIYKGVLPRYAFPTDVVAFHVFDSDNVNQYRPQFTYTPSQGLPIALSQYAPGKSVWIDNKEWSSGALYSPFKDERFDAWENRSIYFECQVCHYAKHVSKDEASVGEERDCDACGAIGKFGKAMNWMRPPGFAHRFHDAPGTSADDAPDNSYATHAKLAAEGPSEEEAWTHITDQLELTYRRDTLLVTNTGPRDEGYTYCTQCGLIEPTAGAAGQVIGPHLKPFPHNDPHCPGNRVTTGLVLGTDFVSDVLLVRIKVGEPITLSPELLSTRVALRTLSEALTVVATSRLDIGAQELQAEYRPALTQAGNVGLEAEIYLYDTLAGGAGFAGQVREFGRSIFEDALERLEFCPDKCDASCYRCLRSFGNRFEHGLLDRRVGAALLKYVLDGTLPALDDIRVEQSIDRLLADLQSRNIEGVTFHKHEPIEVDGVGSVTAPILARSNGSEHIFYIQKPLTRDTPPNEPLRDAKEFGGVPVHPIDDLVVMRNLPFATQQVLTCLG